MSKFKHDLIVVAHPDDETIFFGALLLARRKQPWKVVCVTDGNADGMGAKRHRQFQKACGLLKAKETEWLGFPDVFESRLDTTTLIERLRGLPKPETVFTHGVLGEYGHPHHQDVSFAVHSAFQDIRPVYSVAYNCFPDVTVKLTRPQYELKARILSKIYLSETQRFANLLPATAFEGFTRVDFKEVEALYRYFCDGMRPSPRSLKTYAWFWDYLKSTNEIMPHRLF